MSNPGAVIVVLAVLLSGCGARTVGPPAIVADRIACSHCGMFVSDLQYAAAYQAHGNDPRVFDDIGCMLDAVRSETASPVTVWLQDAAGAGWIDADHATFVAAAQLKTPMSGGLLAYADPAAAEASAAAHGGRVLRSWQALITWKGEAQ